MKCPYCGIYYMDDDKVCPVCGKHPGIQAAKKASRHSSNPKLDIPYKPAPKKASGKATARKQTYNNPSKSTESAWQQAAAGRHLHDNPLERKKTSGCGSGCLVVVIILIVLFVINIIGAVGFTRVANTDSWTDTVESFLEDDTMYSYDDDDIYEDVNLSDIITGTWTNRDHSLTIVIDDEGTLFWTTEDGDFSDAAPLCGRVNLMADNADDFYPDEEREEYPLDSYTYYSLHGWDLDADEDGNYDIELWLYIPNAYDGDMLTSFDYYDYHTAEYGTFTFVSGII